MREVLGDNDVLLSDVGAHKLWIARMYACAGPNTCIISNGFASMGIALPGAIGAKLLYPVRRVLAACPVDYGENLRLTEKLGAWVCPI